MDQTPASPPPVNFVRPLGVRRTSQEQNYHNVFVPKLKLALQDELMGFALQCPSSKLYCEVVTPLKSA